MRAAQNARQLKDRLFAENYLLAKLVSAGFVVGTCLVMFLPQSGTHLLSAKVVDLDPALAQVESVSMAKMPDVRHLTLKKNDTVYGMLREEGIDSADILNLVKQTKKQINLSHLRPGTTFRLTVSETEPQHMQSLEVDVSDFELAKLSAKDGEWVTELVQRELEKRVEVFQGQVVNSLWESGVKAGVDFAALQALTEVFAWQIDFNREVRPNDKWRMAMERMFVDGKPIGWGRVLAAEYVNKKEVYSAIWYESPEGKKGHYFPDGTSLKKMFLKSPIRFGRISSRFNPRRFHPILKRKMPHNGVDYAAPTGTAIRAVGDGRVTAVGYKGASGKHIAIRHNSTYKTSYSHLSRYAKGMKRGKKVSQGDVIGYVGSTGRATGPHLHFSFYQNGRFVNPLGKKFPSAKPVAKTHMAEFNRLSGDMLNQLPTWSDSKLGRDANEIAAEINKEKTAVSIR